MTWVMGSATAWLLITAMMSASGIAYSVGFVHGHSCRRCTMKSEDDGGGWVRD